MFSLLKEPALTAAMATHQTVRTVTEADFHTALGRDASPDSPEATAWLNRIEMEAETVLFIATPEATPWSRTAIRQADQAVFVAQAGTHTDPSPLETFAMEVMSPDQRRLVLIHPHRATRVTGTARWLDSRPVSLHHHLALGDDSDITRLARFLAGRAIGLVCSGGGAFGVAHVGVYKAMVDLGIPVDIMGGTSVGSAMTGAIAIGVPANEIGQRVEEIFVRSGAMRKITVPKYAFLDHTVLDGALLHHFGAGAIEDLWLPYYAVAADLSAVGRRDIRRGPLWEAIRASSAIPGVLPAFYTHDGAMLVDGGCIDNLPFRTMHGLKSGPNIVVNVQKESGSRFNVDYASLPGRMALLRKTLLPFGKRPPRAPGVISTVMRSLLVGQADTVAGLDPTDILISPPILEGAGFLAWEKHKLIFEVSYKHAKDHFAALIAQNDPAFAGLLAAAGLDGRASWIVVADKGSAIDPDDCVRRVIGAVFDHLHIP